MSKIDLSTVDMDSVRRRVRDQVKTRRSVMRWTMFALNLGFYVLGMGMFWGAALSNPELSKALETDASLVGILIIPSIFWGMTVLYHFLSTLSDSGVFDKQYQRDGLTAALNEELLGDLLSEDEEKIKRKRQQERLEDGTPIVDIETLLSDDGELTQNSTQK